MNIDKHIIRVYFMPQSFPCGPQSSCCGPVGQSEKDLQNCVNRLQEALPEAPVECIDISQPLNMARDLAVIKLLKSYGPRACPVIVLDTEVLSVGFPPGPELLALLKTKLGKVARAE